MAEILREITVCIVLTGFAVKEVTADLINLQTVIDFVDLDKEVLVTGLVIGLESSLTAFLGNNEVGLLLHKRTTIEETKITVGQEMLTVCPLGSILGQQGGHVEMLTHEDILLLYGITIAQRLHDG